MYGTKKLNTTPLRSRPSFEPWSSVITRSLTGIRLVCAEQRRPTTGHSEASGTKKPAARCLAFGFVDPVGFDYHRTERCAGTLPTAVCLVREREAPTGYFAIIPTSTPANTRIFSDPRH
jgi:hypothetical protein